MSERAAREAAAGPGVRPRHFFAALPPAALLCALLVGVASLVPLWKTQLATPEGWEFTGNAWGPNPDVMQYRAWFRWSRETGVLVPNRFTAEPNRPHLPVVLYYAVGRVSAALGVTPELVYGYAGALFAAALALLVFCAARWFSRSRRETWWITVTVWLGGGVGAWLGYVRKTPALHEIPGVERLIVIPLRSTLLFEDYRSHYLIKTFFDPHFSLIWLVALAAVLSLYACLRRASPGRLLLLAALCAASTVLHFYEAVTLAAIAVGVALLCVARGVARRRAVAAAATALLALFATLAVQLWLYRTGGLPIPSWRAVDVLFSIVLISYPLAWGLIAWGLARYWRDAGLDRCFLLGWILGCTALLLSAPFYPYPDRGSMTLQVPLHIVAANVWFGRFERVPPAAALVAVLLLGGTTLWTLDHRWNAAGFDPEHPEPVTHLDPDRRTIRNALREVGGPADVLLAEQPDALWLTPFHDGPSYAAHWFLTLDYDRKQREIEAFFAGDDPAAQRAFLDAAGIDLLYAAAHRDPERFRSLPGVSVVRATPAGTLFEVDARAPDGGPSPEAR